MADSYIDKIGLGTWACGGDEQFPKTDQRSAKSRESFLANAEYLKELKTLIDSGMVSSFPELAIRFAAFAPKISQISSSASSG